MTPFYIGNSSQIDRKVIKKKIMVVNIILFFSVLAVICLYLIEMNAIAVFGYKIQDLKIRIDELNSVNQLLEIEMYKSGSMSNLSILADELKMVKISQADYIWPAQSRVAAK